MQNILRNSKVVTNIVDCSGKVHKSYLKAEVFRSVRQVVSVLSSYAIHTILLCVVCNRIDKFVLALGLFDPSE